MKLSVTRIYAFAFAIGAGLVGNAGPSSGAATPQRSPQVRELLSKVPLWFEANESQAASEVEFLARGPGYGLFLAPTDITLALSSPTVRLKESAASHPTGLDPATAPHSPAVVPTTLRLKLLNANPAPRLVGREPMVSKSHYLVGSDPAGWRTNVAHFRRVAYGGVYPGVDLVFYGNERQLEFDFVVAPGSDPRQVQFDLEGADSIDVDAGGDLVLTSAGHEIRLHKPVTYQHVNGSRCEVQSSFVLLDENRVAFNVADYDVSQTLVIDPVLSFASYVGGWAKGVAVDGSGNIYVAGNTRLANLTTTPGAVGPSSAGESDVFVMKLSPDGSSVLYATYLGGSKDDLSTSIAVDSQGNAIISGYTYSADFPLASAQLGGNVDAFVAKLNATGTALVYSRHLGGKPRFEMEPLSIDFGMVRDDQSKDATITIRNTGTVPFTVCAGTGGGAVTFVGTTASCLTGSENEHVNFDAKITVPALSQTSFTIRFDPIGRGHDKGSIGFHNGDQGLFAEFIWKGEGIRSPFPPDPAPEDPPRPFLNIPPFFIELGDSDDFAYDVAVDQAGNAYVVGSTASANFPAPNSIQPYRGSLEDGKSLNDAFVTKLSPEGQILFSTYLGGSGFDYAAGVTVDGNGDIYIGGNTSSADFPEPLTDLHRLGSAGDGFVTKLNAAGSARIYSTLLGGVGVADLAVDSTGAAYFTGRGGVAQLPTPNAFQTAFAGGLSDAFVAKLDPGGASLAYFTRLGGSGDDEGNAIAVDSSGSAYVTGYTQSTDFPPKDPLQANNAGGSSSFPRAGDAFITRVAPDGSDILFSTYLGDSTSDTGLGIALNGNGDIIVAGFGGIPPKNAPAGWTTPTGGFVAMINQGAPPQEIQVWQLMEVPNPMGANPGLASLKPASSAVNFRVVFSRNVGGIRIEAEAEILEVTGTVIRFRVPVDLLGPSDVPAPPLGTDPNVTLEIFSRPDGRLLVRMINLVLRLPQPLIVDEIELGAAAIRNVLQFLLGAPSPRNHTFVFLGRSGDGGAGLRLLNTALRFPQPLRFETDDLVVFEPNPATGRFRRIGAPFHIPNLGPGNQGVQFSVSQNGMYVIALEANRNSPGPFPARYQLHLAANVGLPRKLINGVREFQRGIRLDTLFNHPAPRTQGIFPGDIGVARTALFKFANVASISQFAQAVMIPPAGGFTVGMRIVRAADPTRPVDITTPTARTPESAAPVIGTVIDFTQVPIPESLAQPPPPALTETAGAVIGANDGNGLTLPKTFPNAVTVSSLILDMGSGHEIVDGTGADFEVLAATGSYTVRVGNTPYADSFSSALGPFSGVQQIDLASAGLKSARYVWIIPAPSVVLDAVRSLNLFADEISPTIGPITHVTSATVLARRAKDGTNLLDPFVQLIAPNGDLFGEDEAAFGDDLSQDLSDAALINRILPQDGFYRYLVKGYDKQPDNQSSGTFFTRLETSGNYDPVELVVSTAGEEQTPSQKTGTISATRQRDSFLFQAAPGTRLSIAVNAKSGVVELDPAVELYDPEDFLIAANDNGGTTRGKNPALLNVVLPATTTGGSGAPSPSTYRIVVSALDGFGNPSPLPVVGQAHIRQAASGGYELKVFTGAPAGGVPRPRIDNVNPTSGPVGTPVTITGANFNTAANQNVVRFGNAQATVSSASATQIVTMVPASLSPGAVPVTVSVVDQTSAAADFMVTALVQTPEIDVLPTQLAFGTVAVGQTRDLTLEVRNLGSGELRVQSIGVNSPFALVSPSAPFTVGAGAAQILTFRFAPTVARNEASGALILSNDADEASVSVSLAGMGSSGTPVAKQAQASLHGLSLRFQRATGTFFGERYDLELTSLSLEDPANGELFPAFLPSYSSTFILKEVPLEGSLFVRIPETGDSNGNELDDFFEVNRGVNPVATVGTYTTDFEDGTIKATWSRQAGSNTGTCHLELKGVSSDLEADFSVTFELLEYSGPITYTASADAVSANVKLGRVPNGSDSLSGPLNLTRISAAEFNRLNIVEGQWSNGAGKKAEYSDSDLKRSATVPSTFSAELIFQDGDLSTVAKDYIHWVLVITDPNDSDADGIPDLSDPSTVEPPSTLKFISTRFENTVIVITWQGNGRLQSAASLTDPWSDQPFAESPARVTANDRQQFFRLVQP